MANEKPMGPTRIGRALFSESFKNFSKDRFVMLFPLFAFVANIVVFAAIVVSLVVTVPGWYSIEEGNPIFAVVLAVVMTVFAAFTHVLVQASVMAAANQRYSGQTPTFASALGVVGQKLGRLTLFALVEASVGMILRTLRDNLKGAGGLISFIGGMAWAVASYFAIPAILFEGLGPIQAIRRSTEIIKSKWGSAVRVNLFAGVIFLFAWILTVGGIFGGVYIAVGDFGAITDATLAAGLSITAVSLVVAFALGLIQSSVTSYACVALYRYAVDKPLPEFDSTLMDGAFRIKKQKYAGI